MKTCYESVGQISMKVCNVDWLVFSLFLLNWVSSYVKENFLTYMFKVMTFKIWYYRIM